MSNLNPMTWLTPQFLWRILQKQPDEGRLGFRQRYIQPTMAPFENVWTRTVLAQRAKAQNPMAGWYSPKGEAIPATGIGYDQFLMNLQDVKAADIIDPDMLKDIIDIGELATFNASSTSMSKAKAATVMRELSKKITFCNDQIDTAMEYMFVNALQNDLRWPPTDDDGNAISNPPDYWNSNNHSGTFPYPLEANKVQDITALVDLDGNNPGATIRTVWSDASADILGAIRVIRQLMLETYAIDLVGGTMMMATITRDHFLANTGMLNFLAGVNKEQTGARQFISDDELRSTLQTTGDMNIQRYDSFWTYTTDPTNPNGDQTVNRVKFLKPGKVIFMPRGGVGATMGTVPLKTGPGANATWAPGKFTWSWENPKPNYDQQVGVNVVSWPLFGDDAIYPWFVLDTES